MVYVYVFDTVPPTLPLPMQEVLNHCQLSNEMFTLYLQQNYIDFFTTLEDIVSTFSKISWYSVCYPAYR